MQRLVPLLLAVGAFAAGLTLTALCVNSAPSTGDRGNAGDVARLYVQQLIDGDQRVYESLVLKGGPKNPFGFYR